MIGVEGKNVLLTGASSGIGRALALRLGAGGARLAIAARREEMLEEVAAEIEASGGIRPRVLPADLSRRGAGAELAGRALRSLEGIDVLINNAGGSVTGLEWEVADRDEGRRVFEINLWAPLALVGELVPTMRAQDGGTIVNVTSLLQVSPFPRLGHTAASKSALALATETLRLESRRGGITVIEAALGVVDTAASAANRDLPGGAEWIRRSRPGTAQGAAEAIIRAIERREPRVIYPRPLKLVYALPWLGRRFARRMSKIADRASDTSPAPSQGGNGATT
jgi:short-subunit dehydrogenase